MNQQYELTVSLTIKGPIISSGGGDAMRGLNRVFSCNAEDKPVLRGSHVKGKLREAMQELSTAILGGHCDLDTLFGKEQQQEDAGPRHPQRAEVLLSDFTLTEEPTESRNKRNTRVSIDRRTGTSREQHLQMLQNRFKSGSSTTWNGAISFFSPDDEAAQALGEKIELGLKWITALGGAKGTGYGRLEKVTTVCSPSPKFTDVSLDGEGSAFALCFEFIDDLLIGGQKKSDSNFVESKNIIPGSTIKGSFARFLNLICGTISATQTIDEHNTAVAEVYPQLAKYFSRLRFLHAFPAHPELAASPEPAASSEEATRPEQVKRPVVIPYSAVQGKSVNGKYLYFDVALLEEAVLDEQGHAPKFQIDWKESEESVAKLRESLGWGSCEIINKTRTAIAEKTRTAKDEKLYTFQYLTPYQVTDSGEKHSVRWISSLMLPKIEQVEEKKQLLQELNQAIGYGWCSMGKRDSRFRLVDIGKGPHVPHVASRNDVLSQGDHFIILLQTDTLMFDAKALAREGCAIDLQSVYQEYWNDITDGSIQLQRFFARQQMSGGYLAKKLYPLYPDCYYPYVLTEAGSVFVLQIRDEAVAKNKLSDFVEKGLPLPKQITALLPKVEHPWEHWKTCPYVPENGYGEIIVNLDWHWEKSLSSPAKGGAS